VRTAYSLALLATTIGLVAGCGGSGGDSATGSITTASPATAPNADSATVSAPPSAPAVPEQLNFTAKTVSGAEFSGSTLAGKPAVLWFWAPWCATCQREAPGVAEAARSTSAVTFVGVAALDQVPAMQEFVDKYDIGFFTNIADVDGDVWQRFGVTAQPAFAFVSADGAVDIVRGTLSEQDLMSRVDALAKP